MVNKTEKSIYDSDVPWYIYIVECKDLTYYTGISHDLNKRIKAHNSGYGVWYTEEHGPVTLVYFDKYPNHKEAAQREKEIKKFTHNKKKDLVDNFFPTDQSLNSISSFP